MKLGMLVVAWMPVSLVAFACASVEESTSSTPDIDSGAEDVDASSPPPDAGSTDDARRDAGPSDAGRVELACDGDPCYVAVSGTKGRHFCGLLRDGTVRCWGRDTLDLGATPVDGGATPTDGALGRGHAVSVLEGATPAPVVGLSDVTQISVGPNLGTCARTSDGSVYCWGRNEFGQLGRPASETRLPVPTRVEGLPPVDEVELGFQTGCAIGTSDRALYCWGRWLDGLGIDTGWGSSFGPQLVTTFRPPVKAVRIGTWTDRDTIIALLDGNVLANVGEWLAGETSLIAPTSAVELTGVTSIGAFGYVADDRLTRRWGPTDADPAVAAAAAGLTGLLHIPLGSSVVDLRISAANPSDKSRTTDVRRLTDNQGGALLATGRLFRWGLNLSGTLGTPPDELVGTRAPVEITQVKGQAISFAMTVASTCVSLSDGSIKCWGANSNGELGRGTVDLDPHPEAEVIR